MSPDDRVPPSGTTPSDGNLARLAGAQCPYCGGLGFIRHEVPVGHPDFGRSFSCACSEAAVVVGRDERLLQWSHLDRLGHMTFARTDPKGPLGDPDHAERFVPAFNLARAFADHPEGWLVLSGPSGTGKTHLAAAIAHGCREKGITAFFIGVPDLLDHLRSSYSPESDVSYDDLLDYIASVPVLVLDDLDAHSATPWAREKLFQLLDHRYVRRLPTVITTATSPNDLEDRLCTRLNDPSLSTVRYLEHPRPLFEEVGGYARERLEDLRFHRFEVRDQRWTSEEQTQLRVALETAQAFAERPEDRPFLVLQGRSGVGKTHLAAAIVNQWLDEGNPAFFAFVPDLLDHLRAAFGPESREPYSVLFERVRTAPLLILDDLGAHSATAWAQEKLFQIINYRWLSLLPTVITIRTSVLELGDLDERVASRLWDKRYSRVLRLEVPDYRTGKRWTLGKESGGERSSPRPGRRSLGR